MKKLLLSALLVCFSLSVFAQTNFTQLPVTPLTYLGYEITSPKIKSGYTKRTQYLFVESFSFEMGTILQKKYTDLPLYSFFSEKSDFISYVESKTTVARQTNFIAYTLEARSSDTDPYAVYAKDTFFLSGTTITSISETIYDIEDNTVESYATYDVFYHANGKIERIKLKKSFENNSLSFAGVSVAYNSNNTLKTDSTFKFEYDGSGEKSAYVSIYKDHTYKSATPLIVDSTFYNQVNSTPILNAKYTYVLNANNEITKVQGYSYSAINGKYENNFYYDFGQEPTLAVLSKSNASTVTLYPNPVQDLINVPADCSFQSWSITSITGLTIKTGTHTDLNKIPVADLEAGVYVLTLNNNQETWTGKFIK